MSKSYKHTNGSIKVFRGYILAELRCHCYLDERCVKKLKNGVPELDVEQLTAILHGHYRTGVPKAFRKGLVKQERSRKKSELKKAFSLDDFDEVGKNKFKKNAAWYYF